MRTSTKYLVEALQEGVRAHLLKLFPSNLSDYRSQSRKEARGSDFHGVLGVNIGEQCLPTILPVAYYECAIRPIEETLDGIEVDVQRTYLSTAVQRTALVFRERLHHYIAALTNFAEELNDARLQLGSRDRCDDKGLHFALILESGCYRLPHHDILRPVMRESQDEQDRAVVCESCQARLMKLEKRFQNDVWAMLPEWCGRGDWLSLQTSTDT